MLLNAKPEIRWQILNENTSQKCLFCVLILGLESSENLGFFLSEFFE
jgi:hypothetical protein